MPLNDRSRVVNVTIESEMKTSYIDYSMSVIVSRALVNLAYGYRRRVTGLSIGNTAWK